MLGVWEATVGYSQKVCAEIDLVQHKPKIFLVIVKYYLSAFVPIMSKIKLIFTIKLNKIEELSGSGKRPKTEIHINRARGPGQCF